MYNKYYLTLTLPIVTPIVVFSNTTNCLGSKNAGALSLTSMRLIVTLVVLDYINTYNCNSKITKLWLHTSPLLLLPVINITSLVLS